MGHYDEQRDAWCGKCNTLHDNETCVEYHNRNMSGFTKYPAKINERDGFFDNTDYIIPLMEQQVYNPYNTNVRYYDNNTLNKDILNYMKYGENRKQHLQKLDIFHMSTAWILSQESKCISNRVACVIVKDNRIISSGYNGTKSGHKNCCDHAKDMGWTEDGKHLLSKHRLKHREWSSVNEYHAEQNAIDSASRMGVPLGGSTLYVNVSPCLECCKRITNIGIKRVVYSVEYDNANKEWKDRLSEHGIEVDQITVDDLDKHGHLDFKNIEYFMVK